MYLFCLCLTKRLEASIRVLWLIEMKCGGKDGIKPVDKISGGEGCEAESEEYDRF